MMNKLNLKLTIVTVFFVLMLAASVAPTTSVLIAQGNPCEGVYDSVSGIQLVPDPNGAPGCQCPEPGDGAYNCLDYLDPRPPPPTPCDSTV